MGMHYVVNKKEENKNGNDINYLLTTLLSNYTIFYKSNKLWSYSLQYTSLVFMDLGLWGRAIVHHLTRQDIKNTTAVAPFESSNHICKEKSWHQKNRGCWKNRYFNVSSPHNPFASR